MIKPYRFSAPPVSLTNFNSPNYWMHHYRSRVVQVTDDGSSGFVRYFHN